MLTNLHAWPLERLDCGLIKGMASRPTIAKSTKTNAGCAADRVQLATYPQSPFSGPVRLWISLGAVLSFVLMHYGAAPGKHPQNQHYASFPGFLAKKQEFQSLQCREHKGCKWIWV